MDSLHCPDLESVHEKSERMACWLSRPKADIEDAKVTADAALQEGRLLQLKMLAYACCLGDPSADIQQAPTYKLGSVWR